MEIISSVADMKRWSRAHLGAGKTIGLVPTMGYLHEGHLSLMQRGRSENNLLVTSIFVNPVQFGQNEDLDSYPRDTEGDLAKCSQVGVDAVYIPSVSDVYGPAFQTYVEVEDVAKPLCGASRPGHFRGVATVVLKLFNVVSPTAAYFGQKDYQQLRVIRTMAHDLDLDVTVVSCPTMREKDGLAMSSRNSYLSPQERRQAVCIFQALQAAQGLMDNDELHAEEYVKVMSERIQRETDARIDYVSLVHPETLQNLDIVGEAALAALAVRIGKTRLIDNMLLQHHGPGKTGV